MDNLFTSATDNQVLDPLTDRMRPKTPDDADFTCSEEEKKTTQDFYQIKK